MDNSTISIRLPYMPALDGLRGICILIVVIYHLGLPYTEGGHLGVDGFFVLSGFLITGLLLQEWKVRQSLNLGRFYARRALRLLPALLLLLLTVAVVTVLIDPNLVSPSYQAGPNLRGVGTSLIYASNWAMIYFPNFGITDTIGVLGHTWSLAIEEQFYLIWPIILIFLLRRLSKRGILLSITLGILIIVLWRSHLYLTLNPLAHPWQSYENMRLYVGTDVRSDALLVGALLACLVSFGWVRPGPKLRSLTRFSLAALLPLLVWSITAPIPFRFGYLFGGFTAVDIAFALLILHTLASPAGAVVRLLTIRPLRYVGKVSYGLYLWNSPIFIAFGLFYTTWSNPPLQITGLLVTAAVVVLSYHFLEVPALRLKSYFDERHGDVAYAQKQLSLS